MSIALMNAVWDSGPDGQAEAYVLLAIADYASPNGIAYPGLPLIAQKSRMSERNVIRVIRSLEIQGWLTVSRRTHRVHTARGWVRQGNMYCLNVARLLSGAKTKSADAVSDDENTDDTVSPREITSVAKKEVAKPRGDKTSPENHEVTMQRDEVTKTTPRGDKASFPIRKNHQEPSLEPKPSQSLPLGGLTLREVLNGIRKLKPQTGNAADLQDQVEAHMRSAGFAVEREVRVEDRGDGRPGRIDLQAKRGDENVVFELDARIARDKSLMKLKALDAYRVIVLRTAPMDLVYTGIDSVIALNWPGNGFVPAAESQRSRDVARAMVGAPTPVMPVRDRSHPLSSADVRAGLARALAAVRADLAALKVQNAAYGNILTDDFLGEWDAAMGRVEYERHEAPEGSENGLEVMLTSPVPRLTTEMLARYDHRLEAQMRIQLASRVHLRVTSAEEVAA